jgi:hypothetical protein
MPAAHCFFYCVSRQDGLIVEKTGTGRLADQGASVPCGESLELRPGVRAYLMSKNKGMRTLIYKRTHSDDPDPTSGVFGNCDCMGQVRGWVYDAVIGVGGLGHEAQRNGIDRKLTWVGIGPTRTSKRPDPKRPDVTFEHFKYWGPVGQFLKDIAPNLARRVYDGGVRVIMSDSLPEDEAAEVEKILELARTAAPSGK